MSFHRINVGIKASQEGITLASIKLSGMKRRRYGGRFHIGHVLMQTLGWSYNDLVLIELGKGVDLGFVRLSKDTTGTKLLELNRTRRTAQSNGAASLSATRLGDGRPHQTELCPHEIRDDGNLYVKLPEWAIPGEEA